MFWGSPLCKLHMEKRYMGMFLPSLELSIWCTGGDELRERHAEGRLSELSKKRRPSGSLTNPSATCDPRTARPHRHLVSDQNALGTGTWMSWRRDLLIVWVLQSSMFIKHLLQEKFSAKCQIRWEGRKISLQIQKKVSRSPRLPN